VFSGNGQIEAIFIGNDVARTMAKSMRLCLSCPMITLCFGSLATKAYANGAKIKRARRAGHAFKNVVPIPYFYLFKSGLLDRLCKVCLRQTTGNSSGPQ
jgi:hypothetical protein